MQSAVDWKSAGTNRDYRQMDKFKSLEENFYLESTFEIFRPMVQIVEGGEETQYLRKENPALKGKQ